MSKTITLTDEQWEALQRGESITIEPPKKKKWEPGGGEWVVAKDGLVDKHLLLPPNGFGMVYASKSLAERAAEMMRPIHRYISYALEHWPEYEAPDPMRRAYYVTFNPNSSSWVIHNHTGWRLPWIPYGPGDKVQELVDKLNSGEVEL